MHFILKKTDILYRKFCKKTNILQHTMWNIRHENTQLFKILVGVVKTLHSGQAPGVLWMGIECNAELWGQQTHIHPTYASCCCLFALSWVERVLSISRIACSS